MLLKANQTEIVQICSVKYHLMYYNTIVTA